jgi:hypothetical protein
MQHMVFIMLKIQGEHKVFPWLQNIYYKKTTWNTIFFKVTQLKKFFYNYLSNGKKYDVFLSVRHSINLF